MPISYFLQSDSAYIDNSNNKGWVPIIRTFFNSHLHHEIQYFFLKKSSNSVLFVQAKTYQQV